MNSDKSIMSLKRSYWGVGILIMLCIGCRTEKIEQHREDGAVGLLNRILKDKASLFIVEYIEQDSSEDVFELESSNGKIILRGNNGVSVASALNYYLKHFCNNDISWNNRTVSIPDPLPLVESKVRKTSPYQYRYYLNYCTFNYSMAWWDWTRWQQEIDWMALNGINMPLALTGEEAIWRDVYHELGFNNEELGSFFSGPSYFSWLWMGNIDGWGGPLPQHWMDSHKDLQKQILAYERSLGMKPVLPAFTGHVPPSFDIKFPEAKLKKTNWGAGFNDVYILDPEDPMFAKIGAMFLKAQTSEYGTDHFYSADTFNENVPPTDDPEFLTNVSRKVFRSMADTDPKAVWVMQGWMFHYNSEFWKPEQIKALFAAVPDNQMIILDLYSESHPVWKQTEAYYGKPWIWNMLQNFGGNVAMFGRMKNVAEDPAAAMLDPTSGKLSGIGLAPEGIEQNPALFELMLENVWQIEPVDLDVWLTDYSKRRYGAENDSINKAWSILKNTVYNGGLTEGGQESILVARPTFEKKGHRVLTELNYDPLTLAKAWEIFVNTSSDFQASEGYRYDLVDITRQVLANYADPLQQQIASDYKRQDLSSFKKHSKEFIQLIDDLDTLLGTHRDFLFGKWVNDARSWGADNNEKDLYEFNARDLVTLWGDQESELHEYSNRQWSGLLKGFYKPRWEKFFEEVASSMEAHKPTDLVAFEKNIKSWEWDWVNSTKEVYPDETRGNSFDVARALYKKYYPVITAAYLQNNKSVSMKAGVTGTH
jgi:alpha-N-acetylglucosaminidase